MKRILTLGVVAMILVVTAYVAWGKVQEALLARAVMHTLTEAGLTAEALKKLAAAGYQADPQILTRIATGGQPLGRWKEGLMFEGIAPTPWFKSDPRFSVRIREGLPRMSLDRRSEGGMP